MASDPDTQTPGIQTPPEMRAQAQADHDALETLHEQILHNGLPEHHRMLVHAVYYGHDYLDVQVDSATGAIDHVAWDAGNEPGYDLHVRLADRYDLRDISLADLQTMPFHNIPRLNTD